MRLPSESNQQLLDEFNRRDRRPTGVMIQVSAKCNLGCTMCGYVGRTPNTGFIALPLFERILDDCRAYGVNRIYMETAWGEPMLHPKIFELLEMAASFEIILSTNITPLNPGRIVRLAEMGLHTLQMSYAGYDRESYEMTYVGARFEHVAGNLKSILSVFRGRSSSTKLMVNGVSLHRDPAFVRNTIDFLLSLGFQDREINISLAGNFGGQYTGMPKDIRGIYTYKDLSDAPLEICSVLLNNPGIYVDGRVTACGCVDNSAALIIGDIHQESLRNMRYGARYEAILRAFAHEEIRELALCKDCDVPYCSSRLLNYPSPE